MKIISYERNLLAMYAIIFAKVLHQNMFYYRREGAMTSRTGILPALHYAGCIIHYYIHCPTEQWSREIDIRALLYLFPTKHWRNSKIHLQQTLIFKNNTFLHRYDLYLFAHWNGERKETRIKCLRHIFLVSRMEAGV